MTFCSCVMVASPVRNAAGQRGSASSGERSRSPRSSIPTGPNHSVRLNENFYIIHVDEHRGLHEEPRFEPFRTALAPDQHLGSFFDALTDVGLHALVLLLRCHGSDSNLRIG